MHLCSEYNTQLSTSGNIVIFASPFRAISLAFCHQFPALQSQLAGNISL